MNGNNQDEAASAADDDRRYDERQERMEHGDQRKSRMRHYCTDRTCGGDDCLTCFPFNRDEPDEEEAP